MTVTPHYALQFKGACTSCTEVLSTVLAGATDFLRREHGERRERAITRLLARLEAA